MSSHNPRPICCGMTFSIYCGPLRKRGRLNVLINGLRSLRDKYPDSSFRSVVQCTLIFFIRVSCVLSIKLVKYNHDWRILCFCAALLHCKWTIYSQVCRKWLTFSESRCIVMIDWGSDVMFFCHEWSLILILTSWSSVTASSSRYRLVAY